MNIRSSAVALALATSFSTAQAANTAVNPERSDRDAQICLTQRSVDTSNIIRIMEFKKHCTDAFRRNETPQLALQISWIALQYAKYMFANKLVPTVQTVQTGRAFLDAAEKGGLNGSQIRAELDSLSYQIVAYQEKGGLWNYRGKDQTPSGVCVLEKIEDVTDRRAIINRQNACLNAYDTTKSSLASYHYAYTELLLGALDYSVGNLEGAKRAKNAQRLIEQAAQNGWQIEPQVKKLAADLSYAYDNNIRVIQSGRSLTMADVAIGTAIIYGIYKSMTGEGFTSNSTPSLNNSAALSEWLNTQRRIELEKESRAPK